MTTTPISLILKQQRNMHNMTPEQVVEQLKIRGINISTKALYAYESGTNLPKVPVFLALCDIYQIRDIMKSFGYNVPLCVGDDEWTKDQYNDFFKASLYEKIFLLAKWGIPSFEGYKNLMTQPSHLVLSDDELDLIKTYRSVPPVSQNRVWTILDFEYRQVSDDTKHTLRMAGRDGSKEERHLTEEEAAQLKARYEQAPKVPEDL